MTRTHLNNQDCQFAFFGSSDFSLGVLDELAKNDLLPNIIITTPDKPKGRGLVLTPPSVKLWAEARKIRVIQPEKLDSALCEKLRAVACPLFIVASYGKIIPKSVLEIPRGGTLNVHPSLLPKYRGPSPIQSAVLSGDEETGVTIMLLDEQMDHGPILARSEFSNKMPTATELSEKLAAEGGKLLAETIPKWLAGEIKPTPQDHSKATYTKKITKEDGLIDLDGGQRQNFLKFQAFAGWPGAYFFVSLSNGKKIRVAIKKADFENGIFKIRSVVPENKKEMPYEIFLRSLK